MMHKGPSPIANVHPGQGHLHREMIMDVSSDNMSSYPMNTSNNDGMVMGGDDGNGSDSEGISY